MSSSLPSATAYHRWPVRAFNTVVRGLNALGVAPARIDEQHLLAAARNKTGLREFGDEAFLGRLRILIDSLNDEAQLNPLGRLLQRQAIGSILCNRLYLHDLLTKHPEILQRQLPDPVVIVGLARSGTTRLHRLMAADDRFLHLKAWESMKPVPYPKSLQVRSANEGKDPRIEEIEQGLKVVLYLGPQIAAVHPLGAHEVEEEVGLIMQDFSTQMFEVQSRVETFAEHLMSHEQTSAYRLMATLLKVVSWFRDDPDDKPWVLKTPQHMQDLDALLKVFPNAKIICPHRDPIKVVGSSCSMTWNSMVRDTDSIDPHWVGEQWLDKTERMVSKTLQVREQLADTQVYDVLYSDITSDWQSALQGIYDFLGQEFTEAASNGMQAWISSNAQHKHGAHKYSLADFGLNTNQVEEKLAFYRQRFSIPLERQNPHHR